MSLGSILSLKREMHERRRLYVDFVPQRLGRFDVMTRPLFVLCDGGLVTFELGLEVLASLRDRLDLIPRVFVLGDGRFEHFGPFAVDVRFLSDDAELDLVLRDRVPRLRELFAHGDESRVGLEREFELVHASLEFVAVRRHARDFVLTALELCKNDRLSE